MSFKDDFAPVLNVSGVSALVQDRVYPGMAEQGCTRPYVVWRRNGGDPLPTLASGAVSRTRLKIEVLVGCYAEDYDAAANLADAVFDALTAGATSGNTRLRIIPRPPADGFDPDTKLFMSVVEASVFHRT